MAQPAVVGIVGAKALRRDLNRLTADVRSPLYQALSAAGKAAVEPVAALTRESLPHVTGRLAGTVRASGTRTGGSVRMGTKAVPYAGWVEFGGRRPDGSERPYQPQGRYLFPAARSLAADAARDYSAALSRLFSSSGIYTNVTANPAQVHD